MRPKLLPILLAALLLLLLSISSSVDAQEGIQVTVAYNNVNVRAAPDPNAPLLGQLHFEATVTALSREDLPDNGGIWVYISGDGLQGWVLSTFLNFPTGIFAENLPVTNELVVEVEGVASVNPNGSIQAYVFSPDAEIGQLNVRLYPNIRSNTIAHLRGGSLISVHFQTTNPIDGDVWLYVTFERIVGWVSADHVSFLPGFSIEQVPLSDVGNTSLAFPPTTEASVQATVNTQELNVRDEPAITAAILGKLGNGATVTIAYREDFPNDETWVYISAPDGLSGWVLSDLLNLPTETDLQSLPINYGPTIPSGAIVAQTRIYSNTTLQTPIYSDGARNADVIGYAPPGALILIQGEEDTLNRGGWVYGTWIRGNLTGWFDRVALIYPSGVRTYEVNHDTGLYEIPQIGNISVLQQPIGRHHRRLDYTPLPIFPEPIPSQGYMLLPCNCYIVRAEPNENSPLIILLRDHPPQYLDVFVVHGRTEDARWLYVTYPEDTSIGGWITTRWEFQYVRGFNRRNVPVIPALANPPLPAARPAIDSLSATTVRPLVIDLETLPTGTSLTVVGRDLFNWSFKVIVNGHEGWLRRDELSINGDFTLLPVLSHSGLGPY